MKNVPNSKANLDKAIQRFAGNIVKANELRNLMANAIVAQMLGKGVVKGGSGLKFRYGAEMTRVTLDLDTAWTTSLEDFLDDLSPKLQIGWNGFTGSVKILRQASPQGIPFDYVMQPCEVKLSYLGRPWYTVQLEIGHNEIGDADVYDDVPPPEILCELFDFLAMDMPRSIPAMRLEYQIAQKLHGASAPRSKRAHDLIDLQLIMANAPIDLRETADLCVKLFKYRKVHAWPPVVEKGEGWDSVYEEQKGALPVLMTVDEAILWVNELIEKIKTA